MPTPDSVLPIFSLFVDNRKVRNVGVDLLGHFGDAFESVEVVHVVSLHPEHLDGRLLSE